MNTPTKYRHVVSVPVGTKVEVYELQNNVIVISAKDCGTHYEFWVI